MKFSNVRFIDIGISNSGSGLLPTSPLKDIPSYDNFVDDCLYIFRKYPSIARTSNTISPTNLSSSEDSNSTWEVTQDGRYGENYGGFRAFDGLYNTEYCFISASGENFPHWVSLRNKKEKICVKSYAIRTRYNSSNSGNYNPQEWRLEGSDDGSTWTTIDSREISWPTSDFGKKIFNVPSNNSSFYYHRLYVTEGNHASYLAIGELELYDEVYCEDNYYTLPTFGSAKSGISNFAFIGCPEEGERFWDILSAEHKTALRNAGWLNSGYKYATIYCSTVQSVNFCVSSWCSFYTENIDYLRNPSTTVFSSVDPYGSTGNFMFFFSGGNETISIRNCRFSAWGVNLDDERYVEPTPPRKCCGYLCCTGWIDRVVMEGNVINFMQHGVSNANYCYDGFAFTSIISGASCITKNDCYMAKSGTSTIIGSNYTQQNTSTYSYPKTMISFTGDQAYSQEFWQQNRFLCFNYNKLTIRVNGYYNMDRWYYAKYAEKIEFVGNTIVQGKDMGTYDQNVMNMYLFNYSLVDIGYSSSYCTDYYIKDFYVNLPCLFGMYGASVARFDFFGEDSQDQTQRRGYNRASKKNIIDNITIILGEGPSISDMSGVTWSRISAWRENNSNCALLIRGRTVSTSYGYFRYANHANTATNITVSHPWGHGVYIRHLYAEIKSLRGGIYVGNASYVTVDSMSIKKANWNSIKLLEDGGAYLRIKNVFVEDPSITNYISPNNYYNGTIIIDKTNYPLTSSNGAFSNESSYYNEFLVIQKDIGDLHGFLLKSTNKFIESCNVKHNSNNTLKMFGLFNHNRSLKLIDTGETGLSSKEVLPGKYRARINMAFYGDDLHQNSVVSPSGDYKNVLRYGTLVIGLKTKYGELSIPDVISTDYSNSNSVWSLNSVILPYSDTSNSSSVGGISSITPFYQEYYIDIYEPQKIFTTIERFNVYSTGFTVGNPTAAVFMDPEIELIKIGDIDYSNSSSISSSNSGSVSLSSSHDLYSNSSSISSSLSNSLMTGTIIGYNISGCDDGQGTSNFNGRYDIVSGLTSEGHPVYSKTYYQESVFQSGVVYLFYLDDRWNLDWDQYTHTSSAMYYKSGEDPAVGSWSVGLGGQGPTSVEPIYG